MRIDVFTLFPDLIISWADVGVIGRAVRSGTMDIRVHDLRLGATDARRSVDDAPFGGGAGMVLCPGPVFTAVEAVMPPRPLYLLGPAGDRFDQAMARRFAAMPGFSLLCGRYEGVDQRIADHLVDGELSIGDFVLAGGEAGAVSVLEAVGRLIPGVLGNEESACDESFSEHLLEYPQYTRPAAFRGWDVPPVLLSGNHANIVAWRRRQSLIRTALRRPDLIAACDTLSPQEAQLLVEHGYREQSLNAQSTTRPDVPSEEPHDNEPH